MQLLRLLKFIFIILGILAFSQAYAAYELNMPRGVTPISHDIYNLHMTIFWICLVIGVVVFGVMFFSLFKHRKSRGAVAAQFHGNLRIELFWGIIPFIILVIMAIPATIVLSRMEDNSKADVNIKVTGYQWKWQYEYLDEGISFFSNIATPYKEMQNKAPKNQWYLLQVDHPVVVPIHKKIRFLVTSNDVIHSWWVPELGIKRDAIPGFIHESWARIEKPGIYRGQCAELCGLNHAFMPIVVDARSEADYEAWVKQQDVQVHDFGQANTLKEPTKPQTMVELMTKGEDVYNGRCSGCHKVDGAGMPPAFPAMKGSKIATGPIADHINIVMKGKAGTAMQAFAQQLNDADIAAVITYERNAFGNSDKTKFGNNAGGMVQAADIAKLRENT
jgi:cytochrome c oxidase subunit 2